jgi:hypothetical protein
VIVAQGVALRIMAALNDMSVGITMCSTNNSNVGRLLVQMSVYVRHFLKVKRERVRGWGERVQLRAEVRTITRRES